MHSDMVVVLINVYGERWLTQLAEVCDHDLSVPVLAYAEQSIFQVWQLYHVWFVSYKWFLQCHLTANLVQFWNAFANLVECVVAQY